MNKKLTDIVISKMLKENCMVLDCRDKLYKHFSVADIKNKIAYVDLSTIKFYFNPFNDFYAIFKLKPYFIRLKPFLTDFSEESVSDFVCSVFFDMLDKSKHFSNTSTLFIKSVELIGNDESSVIKVVTNLCMGFSEDYKLNLNVDFENIFDGNESFLEEQSSLEYGECPECFEDVYECNCGFMSMYDRNEVYEKDYKTNIWKNGHGEVTYDYTKIPVSEYAVIYIYYNIGIYSNEDYIDKYSNYMYNTYDVDLVQEIGNDLTYYRTEKGIPYITLQINEAYA